MREFILRSQSERAHDLLAAEARRARALLDCLEQATFAWAFRGEG